jgi:hypothetical protein
MSNFKKIVEKANIIYGVLFQLGLGQVFKEAFLTALLIMLCD